jgi:hypothetical protein
MKPEIGPVSCSVIPLTRYLREPLLSAILEGWGKGGRTGRK